MDDIVKVCPICGKVMKNKNSESNKFDNYDLEDFELSIREVYKEDLKRELSDDSFDRLVKYNFLDDAVDMISSPIWSNVKLINWGRLYNYEIVGMISQSLSDFNENISVKSISENVPNNCLICLSMTGGISMKLVDEISDKMKAKYPNISVSISACVVPNIEFNKVQAILFYNDKLQESKN